VRSRIVILRAGAIAAEGTSDELSHRRGHGFVSGVFVPLAHVPGWLVDIGRIFPLEYLAAGLRTTSSTASSTGIAVENVAVLGGWDLVGMAVAVRNSEWEPMSRG
jgi:hypothetical protein